MGVDVGGCVGCGVSVNVAVAVEIGVSVGNGVSLGGGGGVWVEVGSSTTSSFAVVGVDACEDED